MDIKEDYSRINIALIPDSKSIEKIIAISEKLSLKFKTFFTLDNKNFFPHVTLYAPRIPLANVEEVVNVIERLSFSIEKFEMDCEKVNVHTGYIGIGFNYSEGLKKLHESIVNMTNPLRLEHTITQEDLSDYKIDFTQEQIEYAKLYGHPSVMKYYNPHLTFTRFIDPDLEIELENLWSEDVIKSEKIGIFQMGDHGTCVKLIREFEL